MSTSASAVEGGFGRYLANVALKAAVSKGIPVAVGWILASGELHDKAKEAFDAVLYWSRLEVEGEQLNLEIQILEGEISSIEARSKLQKAQERRRFSDEQPDMHFMQCVERLSKRSFLDVAGEFVRNTLETAAHVVQTSHLRSKLTQLQERKMAVDAFTPEYKILAEGALAILHQTALSVAEKLVPLHAHQ